MSQIREAAADAGSAARRRNWLAIAVSTVIMMFSYFPYAAAFAVPEGADPDIDVGLLAIALAIAPLVFIAIGFVSRNPKAPKRVLQSMGLLILLGLSFGLISPVLGAVAGFGVGGSITLRPPGEGPYLAWRLAATILTMVYVFLLLVSITPAGVFTGGLLTLLMLGFSDEFVAWKVERDRAVG